MEKRPAAARAAVHVIKIGGSLLSLEDLPSRLTQWLRPSSAAHVVLLVGGGEPVERIRRRDRAEPMDPNTVHWMCIELMAANTRTLAEKLPAATLVDSYGELEQRLSTPGATFFVASGWLQETEPHLPGTPLPIGWQTTSDAIAGRLAIALRAQELVLLKSTPPPPDVPCELAALASCGFFDEVLPTQARELPPTKIVDLRGDPPTTVQLRCVAE